jgi:hypothetical protein
LFIHRVNAALGPFGVVPLFKKKLYLSLALEKDVTRSCNSAIGSYSMMTMPLMCCLDETIFVEVSGVLLLSGLMIVFTDGDTPVVRAVR